MSDEKHYDDGSAEYVDDHGSCLTCKHIEAERNALRAEVAKSHHSLTVTVADRDRWKAKAEGLAKRQELL